jgi:hypothetical protein
MRHILASAPKIAKFIAVFYNLEQRGYVDINNK